MQEIEPNYTAPGIIEIPEVEGWEYLRDYLKTIGFEEVKIGAIYYDDVKPIVPSSKPSCLKFYLNWKYGKNLELCEICGKKNSNMTDEHGHLGKHDYIITYCSHHTQEELSILYDQIKRERVCNPGKIQTT